MAIALSVAVIEVQRATAALPEPWPAFTMVYEDTRFAAGGPVTQTFRLSYTDRRHFSTVLLGHSAVPEAAGWTNVFDADRSTTRDPRLGSVNTSTLAPTEFSVPDDWLFPGPRPHIAYRSGATVVALPGGLQRVSTSYTSDGRAVTEEETYRPDGIPTGFLQTVDGAVSRRITVLQLTLP